VGSTSGS